MTEEKDDIIDNYDPRLLEYPFARRGMTLTEFDEEWEFLCQKYSTADLKKETYIPLWKQRELAEQDYND